MKPKVPSTSSRIGRAKHKIKVEPAQQSMYTFIRSAGQGSAGVQPERLTTKGSIANRDRGPTPQSGPRL